MLYAYQFVPDSTKNKNGLHKILDFVKTWSTLEKDPNFKFRLVDKFEFGDRISCTEINL